MADYTVRAVFEATVGNLLNALGQATAATDKLADSADKAGQATKKLTDQNPGAGLSKGFKNISDGAKAAGLEISGTQGKFTDLGNKSQVAFEKASNAIKTHRAEISTLGGAMTAVGGGITAVAGYAAKTGIAYNTLKQTSTAALTAMTGSAAEAAAQMERLNAFADTSPFSRATWIQAQQQLMAFGMEADRVVPSLEGIQQAVAAIGGGDAEIMRLVDILGTIEGQGKITGRELQRLGQMGIDAAGIIGEQMGKSGNAIRDEISAGAIDAQTAITALTDGMNERFAGSSEGLKNTFEGAIDRLKAAFRDFSADMFSGFVSPDGGGFLIDLTNKVADFLRFLEKLPGPVKQAIGTITLLGGGAVTAAGGFLMFAPRILDTIDAVGKLSSAFPKATGALKTFGGVALKAAGYAAAAGLALHALQAVMAKTAGWQTDGIEAVENKLLSLSETASSTDLDDLLSYDGKWLGLIEHDLGSAEESINRLLNTNWVDSLEGGLYGAINSIFGTEFQTEAQAVESQLNQIGDALGNMVSSGNFDVAQKSFAQIAEVWEKAGGSTKDLLAHMPGLSDALLSYANEAGVALTETELLEWALTGVPPAALAGAEGLDSMGGSAAEAAASFEDLINNLKTLGLLERDLFDAHTDWAAAVDSITESVKENGATLDENTAKGRANRDALTGMIQTGLDLAAAMGEAGESHETIAGQMMETYNQAVAAATAMGMEAGEAERLAAELLGIPDGVDVETFMDNRALEVAQALGAEIEAIPGYQKIDVDLAVDEAGNLFSIQQDLDELEQGREVFVAVNADGESIGQVKQQIMDIDGEQVKVWVTDDGTVLEIDHKLNGVTEPRVTTILGRADTSTADGQLNQTARFRESPFGSTANTSIAENALNHTGRFRESPFGSKANTSIAENALNHTSRTRQALINAAQGSDGGVLGWLMRLTAPRTVTIRAAVAGGSLAGLPGRSTGGRAPATGLGTDKILGYNHAGVPSVWVDDREWIVNRRSSDKYDRAISLINMDHPSIQYLSRLAGGGRAGMGTGTVASHIPVAGGGLDYNLLARAIGERGGATYNAYISNSNAGVGHMTDAFRRFNMERQGA